MTGSGSLSVPRHVWLTTAAFAIAYALYALFRHWHFQSGGYDLGIFEQAIWHLSRFETPANSFGRHPNIFGDHFHPIIALVVPFYWLVPAAETLLVFQSVVLAATLVPVYVYSRARVGANAAVAVAITCGLFWGMQKAAAYDFHELSFAPLLIAVAIVARERRDTRMFAAACVLLSLVKEDMIPLVGVLGLWLVMTGDRRQGLVVMTAAAVAFVLVMKLVIPALSGSSGSPYLQSYASVTGGGLLAPVIQLVTPRAKLMTVISWLAPFAFLPLGSPLVLLAVPIALSRLLSSNPNHWGTTFHYSAPLAPILAMASADAIARLHRRFADTDPTWLRILPTVMVVLAAFIPGRLPLWRLLSPAHYRSSSAIAPADAALAIIPPQASVTAQNCIGAHLAARDRVYVLEPGAPDGDYIVAAEGLVPWPNRHEREVAQLLEERRARGYETAFANGGWTVLRRR